MWIIWSIVTGFKLNIVKLFAKILKPVGEYLPWGATLVNFEKFTPLDALTIPLPRFFPLDEQSKLNINSLTFIVGV